MRGLDPLGQVVGFPAREIERGSLRKAFGCRRESGIPVPSDRAVDGLAVLVPGVRAGEPIEAVQRAVVLLLRSREAADSPGGKAVPVDGAWEALELLPRLNADHALALAALGQDLDESHFLPSGLPGDFLTADPLLLETQVDPGDEQEVAGACLNGARPREHEVGKGVADDADAELVHGLVLAKEVDDVEHPPPLVLGVVQPGDVGHDSGPLSGAGPA